jgi:hypothetical protein
MRLPLGHMLEQRCRQQRQQQTQARLERQQE